MNKILLTKIEDIFDVSGRGIILAPLFPVSEYKFDREYEVSVENPDGSSVDCKATFTVPFQSPPPKVLGYHCQLSGISKSEITVGANLWIHGVSKNEIAANT